MRENCQNLINEKPKKVHKARWHNTGSSTVREYIQTRPSTTTNRKNGLTAYGKLKLTTEIVQKIYFPAMFYAKTNWQFWYGPKIFFYLVKLCRENLKTVFIDGKNVDLLEIAFKKLENNSYYIHQDNIFVSGIKDPDINIRRK